MKIFSLVLSMLVLGSPLALACEPREAAIVGSVISGSQNGTECSLAVHLITVSESGTCPLDVGPGQMIFLEVPVTTGACPQNGAPIAGSLRSNGQGGYRLAH